jgi:tetratricopeptide (TPR) repeat protein
VENDQPLSEEASGMSRVRSRHPDDFTLFCFIAGQLEESERANVGSHLVECDRCLMTFTEIREVDSGLRTPSSAGPELPGAEAPELPPNDPFRERPIRSVRRIRAARQLVEQALESAQKGDAEVEALLGAAASGLEELQRFLRRLSFADPAARYLLLYAFDEAGRRITDAPARFLRFAEEALIRLDEVNPDGAPSGSDAESIVPLSTLVGQAHLLAGQAANWTGELEKARRHFEDAYRSFRLDAESDEIRIALTEFHESQRRSFAGVASEGLALARRARATFERFGLEDYCARARVAEGIALSSLDKDEIALECYRSAVPVFESHGLWSNYASAVNSLGFSLARLGRLDEARREYSRALRIVSRQRHPSLLAFIRNGMGHVLFFGGRYADAAKSFLQAAGLFQELEQIGDALTASLWEIESWARSGDLVRARHRLEIFRAVVGRAEALDPFIVRQLEDALSGRDADLEKIGGLRERAERALREKFEARSG